MEKEEDPKVEKKKEKKEKEDEMLDSSFFMIKVSGGNIISFENYLSFDPKNYKDLRLTFDIDRISFRFERVLGVKEKVYHVIANLTDRDKVALNKNGQPHIYLSCSMLGGKADLWFTDDSSGRQRWKVTRLVGIKGPEGENLYNLESTGTLKIFGKKKEYLSVTNGATVDMAAEDDKSGKQRWILEKVDHVLVEKQKQKDKVLSKEIKSKIKESSGHIFEIPIFEGRWSVDKATKYYNKHTKDGKSPLIGCNYIPHDCVNQLDFWGQKVFKTETIKSDLSKAAKMGMNCVRVTLHHHCYGVLGKDKKVLFKRIQAFIDICKTNNLKIIFVFFDDCWNRTSKPGIQPSPIEKVHNSQWVQSPGLFSSKGYDFKAYITDVLNEFKKEETIFMWDLYNEPGNSGYGILSYGLLRDVVKWARDVDGLTQPITIGTWGFNGTILKGVLAIASMIPLMSRFQLLNSDILSFHTYSKLEESKKQLQYMNSIENRSYPVMCTEYCARTLGNGVKSHLPWFVEKQIGALSMGFVSGKSQNVWQWPHLGKQKVKKNGEPEVWFQDLLRKDGSAFDKAEIELIQKLSGIEAKKE